MILAISTLNNNITASAVNSTSDLYDLKYNLLTNAEVNIAYTIDLPQTENDSGGSYFQMATFQTSTTTIRDYGGMYDRVDYNPIMYYNGLFTTDFGNQVTPIMLMESLLNPTIGYNGFRYENTFKNTDYNLLIDTIEFRFYNVLIGSQQDLFQLLQFRYDGNETPTIAVEIPSYSLFGGETIPLFETSFNVTSNTYKPFTDYVGSYSNGIVDPSKPSYKLIPQVNITFMNVNAYHLRFDTYSRFLLPITEYNNLIRKLNFWDGYYEGITSFEDLKPWDLITEGVSTFLNFEIFPDFYIWYFFLIGIGIALFGLGVKAFMGG